VSHSRVPPVQCGVAGFPRNQSGLGPLCGLIHTHRPCATGARASASRSSVGSAVRANPLRRLQFIFSPRERAGGAGCDTDACFGHTDAEGVKHRRCRVSKAAQPRRATLGRRATFTLAAGQARRSQTATPQQRVPPTTGRRDFSTQLTLFADSGRTTRPMLLVLVSFIVRWLTILEDAGFAFDQMEADGPGRRVLLYQLSQSFGVGYNPHL